jgi:hypothetical protein
MPPAGAIRATGGRLRDTPTWMPRDKVDVARRANDAYNRRDVDGLFAEAATCAAAERLARERADG